MSIVAIATGGASDRLELLVPRVWLGRVEDEETQAILGLLDGGLRGVRSTAPGWKPLLRPSETEVDGRRLPHIHLRLVHTYQFFGERQGCLTCLDVRAVSDQVPEAVFTAAVVWTTVSCSRVSAIDCCCAAQLRFARAPSVRKSRNSGWENEE